MAPGGATRSGPVQSRAVSPADTRPGDGGRRIGRRRAHPPHRVAAHWARCGDLAVGMTLWAIRGGIGRALRGHGPAIERARWPGPAGISPGPGAWRRRSSCPARPGPRRRRLLLVLRLIARQRRRYVRLRVVPFRTDECGPEASWRCSSRCTRPCAVVPGAVPCSVSPRSRSRRTVAAATRAS